MRIKNIKKYAMFGLAMLLAGGLFGCDKVNYGKKNTIETVGVDYPENEEESSLEDIFEYNFSSTWTAYQGKVLEAVKKYDVVHKALTREYWEMFNIAQAGFDEQGAVWVNLSENDKMANRSLDMSYGFYESGFENLDNDRDVRIWTAPNGSKRIIRGINKTDKTSYLLWQQNDGSSYLIAENLKLGDNDLMCTWSGDSNSAFVRILPNSIFPEKDITGWNMEDSGNEKPKALKENIVIEELLAGDIWKVEKKGNDFFSECVYKGNAEDTLKSSMISSYDGRQLLAYMGDCYEAVLTEKETKSRHTATYIEQKSSGRWESIEILHFNSNVDYAGIAFDKENIVVITADGELICWNPQTSEQTDGEMVIDEAYDECLLIPEKELIFVGTSSEIFKYQYDKSSGSWAKKSLYKSPQGSTVINLKYNDENGSLLLLYMLDDSFYNSQRFGVVCIKLAERD